VATHLPAVSQLYRLSFEFKSPSGQGWSESHYLPAGTGPGLDLAAKTLADYRLAILPPTCSLIYAKYSQLGNPRDSEPLNYPFPTAGEWPGDPFVTPATAPAPGSLNIEVSDIAVHLRAIGLDGRGASRWVHGVPDNRVTAELLTDVIAESLTPPPAIGAGGFSTDWAVRFGYYIFHMRLLTVYAESYLGAGGIRVWGTELIKRFTVRGISTKRTGVPFGLRRGHASVGR